MTTDMLTDIDRAASVSLTTAGEVRAAWLEAIQALNDATGTFDASRIRPTLDEGVRHGSEIGALFRELSQSGAARAIDITESGNAEHRATHSLIRVWKLSRRVWPERVA